MAKIADQTVSVSRLTGPRVEIYRISGYHLAQAVSPSSQIVRDLVDMAIYPGRADLERVDDQINLEARFYVRRETSPRRLLPHRGE